MLWQNRKFYHVLKARAVIQCKRVMSLFMFAYPLLFTVFLYSAGMIDLNYVRTIVRISAVVIVPVIPFLMLLIRVMISDFNTLIGWQGVFAQLVQFLVIPVIVLRYLLMFFTSHQWWSNRYLFILVMVEEIVLSAVTLIMGHAFFSFSDYLVLPLIRMGSMQIVVFFVLFHECVVSLHDPLQTKKKGSMILSNTITYVIVCVLVGIPLFLVGAWAIVHSKISNTFVTFLLSAIFTAFGWASVLFLVYRNLLMKKHVSAQ